MNQLSRLSALAASLTLAGCGGGEVAESAPQAHSTQISAAPATHQGLAAESVVSPSMSQESPTSEPITSKTATQLGIAAASITLPSSAQPGPTPQSLTATPTRVIARADNRVIPLTYFGMHFHRINGETRWPAVQIGSWRLWDAQVTWKYLEPVKGSWDWAKLDGYVSVARQRNVQITLPLGLTPTWASARPGEASAYGNGNAAEPANMADWRTYIRTVATRYKGKILFYEIWNEVNEPAFFSGSADKIVELTAEARKVLKEVDPRIKLAGPAPVGSYTGAYDYFGTLLSKGIQSHVDALAYHLYVHSSAPENMVNVVDNLRTRMATYNVSLPLWNTETGWWIANQDGTAPGWDDPAWKHLDQKLAAGYVVRSFVLGWVLGLDQFFWYSWDNYTMGMVEPTRRTAKLGGVAYGNMVTLLAGGRIPQCSLTGSVWTCDVTTKAGREGRIIWSATDTDIVTALPEGWTSGTSIYHFEQSANPVRFDQAQLRAGVVPRMIVKN